MTIKFPRGVSIDADNVPDNLEEIVRKAFGEYTFGTASAYTDEDRLSFIDSMIQNIHHANDADYKVERLIVDRFEWELQDQGRIMEPYEFYANRDFFVECYEAGQKDAQLHYQCSDHHVSDKVNRIIARVIRAVMTWEREESE